MNGVDWRGRAARLSATVAAAAGVDPEWAVVFARVPRHLFVPRVYPSGEPGHVLDATTPDRWLDVVYSDTSLTTQCALTPGTEDLWQPTSSSTRPSLMARMLTLLNARPGHRVLEVGTGTGYNAAILSHRLAADNVASIDIGPELVEAARARLGQLGHHPALATGDGAAGLAEHGPYDRIIATCAVTAIPPAWIRQLADDGVIVADLRGELTSSLIAAHKQPDGTAQGRLLDEPGHFMWLRKETNNPLRNGGELATRIDRDDARTRHASLHPATMNEPGLRSLIQLTAPEIGQIWTTQRDGRAILRVKGDHSAWADYDPAGRTVTQGGPIDLFTLIEHAAALWERIGKPSNRRYGLTASPDGDSTVWLDSPENTVTTQSTR